MADGCLLVLGAVWVAQQRSLSVLPTFQLLVGCSVLAVCWAILSTLDRRQPRLRPPPALG